MSDRHDTVIPREDCPECGCSDLESRWYSWKINAESLKSLKCNNCHYEFVVSEEGSSEIKPLSDPIETLKPRTYCEMCDKWHREGDHAEAAADGGVAMQKRVYVCMECLKEWEFSDSLSNYITMEECPECGEKDAEAWPKEMLEL